MQKEYSSYGLYFRADKKIIKYSIGKTPTRYENTKSPKGSWFLDLNTTKWGKKVPERNRPGSTHTDRRMQNSIFFLILSPSLSLCYSYCSYYDSTMIVSTIAPIALLINSTNTMIVLISTMIVSSSTKLERRILKNTNNIHARTH